MNLEEFKDILIKQGYKKVEVPTYENPQPIPERCMINKNEIPRLPDIIYGFSRQNLDDKNPLVYFETQVSS